jgi:hypothetical protein
MCSEGHTSNSPRCKLPLTPGISKVHNMFVQWVRAMLLIIHYTSMNLVGYLRCVAIRPRLKVNICLHIRVVSLISCTHNSILACLNKTLWSQLQIYSSIKSRKYKSIKCCSTVTRLISKECINLSSDSLHHKNRRHQCISYHSCSISIMSWAQGPTGRTGILRVYYTLGIHIWLYFYAMFWINAALYWNDASNMFYRSVT